MKDRSQFRQVAKNMFRYCAVPAIVLSIVTGVAGAFFSDHLLLAAAWFFLAGSVVAAVSGAAYVFTAPFSWSVISGWGCQLVTVASVLLAQLLFTGIMGLIFSRTMLRVGLLLAGVGIVAFLVGLAMVLVARAATRS